MSKCVKCGNEILTGDMHWEMGLCNNCYNDLYKDHKTHISLDKMWLNIAQSFRDENEKQQQRIAELKAKLAESENRFQEHKQTDSKTIQEQSDLIEQLKQQLAEMTEKYNACQEARKQEIEFSQQDKKELRRQLVEKDDEIEEYKIMHWNMQKQHLDFIKELDQDKISFCIEKLKKAISTVENVLDDALKNNSCNSSYYDKLLDLLDKQIKELKGEE